MTNLGYFADILLFLGSLSWLFDFTPLDFTSKFKKLRTAIDSLVVGQNLLGQLPAGTNFQAESSTMKISQDPETVEILRKYIQKKSLDTKSINWSAAVGVGYCFINVPVGKHNVPGMRPLYVITLPQDLNESKFDLKPLGQLEILQKWIYEDHQRNLSIFVGLLLCIGFVFQVIVRLKS